MTLAGGSWLVFATQGVNKVSIHKIVHEDRLVTTEEALLCIKDETLHPALRSAYIDFIISTLVDVNVEESGTTVENIWHTFVSLAACVHHFIANIASSLLPKKDIFNDLVFL